MEDWLARCERVAKEAVSEERGGEKCERDEKKGLK